MFSEMVMFEPRIKKENLKVYPTFRRYTQECNLFFQYDSDLKINPTFNGYILGK